MQIHSNRYLVMGLIMAALTAATATIDHPLGFEEFTIPIWDILFQFNLCSALVFVIIGVLQISEIETPDLLTPLQTFLTAFCTYMAVCLFEAIGLELALSIKLFLFAVSVACIAVGWALTAGATLKQLDSQH